MKAVWNQKFDLTMIRGGYLSATFPKGATILSAINQMERVVIYALVDPNEKEVCDYKISVVVTGPNIDNNCASWRFIDTLPFSGGTLVLHIFHDTNY